MVKYDDIETMKIKSDEGDLDATVQLGMSYLYGFGIEKDPVQAFIRLQSAALRSDGQAQLHLGYMYEKGLGIKPDLWTAMSLYRKSYNLRTPGSRKALGDILDVIVDTIPITGELTVTDDFEITVCCDKFREYMRMGRVIPFEAEDHVEFFISNMNRDVMMRECPYCGCGVIHR